MKSTMIKLPVHNKEQKGPREKKQAWEKVKKQQLDANDTRVKRRLKKDFPERMLTITLEKRKGPKF